eukprot:3511088-Alexandrium_andersonii.AAC.1
MAADERKEVAARANAGGGTPAPAEPEPPSALGYKRAMKATLNAMSRHTSVSSAVRVELRESVEHLR